MSLDEYQQRYRFNEGRVLRPQQKNACPALWEFAKRGFARRATERATEKNEGVVVESAPNQVDFVQVPGKLKEALSFPSSVPNELASPLTHSLTHSHSLSTHSNAFTGAILSFVYDQSESLD